jgi:hypothetical protein
MRPFTRSMLAFTLLLGSTRLTAADQPAAVSSHDEAINKGLEWLRKQQRFEESQPDYQEIIRKGLEWLRKQQESRDHGNSTSDLALSGLKAAGAIQVPLTTSSTGLALLGLEKAGVVSSMGRTSGDPGRAGRSDDG